MRCGTFKNKARAKISFLSGILQRWVPISKFLTLSAILGPDNTIECTSTPKILGSLVNYWKPIFDGSNVNFSSEAANEVFNQTNSDSWDFSEYRLPGLNTFEYVISKAKDSSPGKDGLPYSARKTHKKGEGIYPCILEECFSVMRSHSPRSPCPPMHGFNTLVQSCIPKKETFPFEQGVSR